MTANKPNLDQQLDDLLADLPEHQAPVELWQTIEPQLEKPQEQSWSWHPWHAIAASVVVAAIALSIYWQPEEPNSYQEAWLSQKFTEQKSALVKTVNGQHAESLVGDWLYQLEIMDASAQQIKQALQLTPNDPDLLKMLEHLYQQQINFLRAIQPQALS